MKKLWYLVVATKDGTVVNASRSSSCPGALIGKAHEAWREYTSLGIIMPVVSIMSCEGVMRRVL